MLQKFLVNSFAGMSGSTKGDEEYHTPEPISHPERYDRRLAIAAHYALTDNIEETSRHFSVSKATVISSFTSFKEKIRNKSINLQAQKMNVQRLFEIIARLLSGDNCRVVGDEFGITRAAVNEIKRTAERCGIDFPNKSLGRPKKVHN